MVAFQFHSHGFLNAVCKMIARWLVEVRPSVGWRCRLQAALDQLKQKYSTEWLLLWVTLRSAEVKVVCRCLVGNRESCVEPRLGRTRRGSPCEEVRGTKVVRPDIREFRESAAITTAPVIKGSSMISLGRRVDRGRTATTLTFYPKSLITLGE